MIWIYLQGIWKSLQSGDSLACGWNNCIDCLMSKRNNVSKNLRMGVSVTYCCVTNQPITHCLKTTIYLAHVSVGWKYELYGLSGPGGAHSHICRQLPSQLGGGCWPEMPQLVISDFLPSLSLSNSKA